MGLFSKALMATLATAVTGTAAATPAARAVAPVVRLAGSASLTREGADGDVDRAASFHVTASFSTDTPGAEPFTIRKAVVYFPDHAGTNGRLFASCDAAQIRRLHGAVGRCPKGSKIGAGTVKARALQLGVAARGRVALFNGNRGRSVTINIQTLHPAAINESIDAPLTQLHGVYGEKLTLVVPHTLQEIIEGVYVGVQEFDVTLGGAVRVDGATYSFLRARTCPTRAVHGVFEFVDSATGLASTATADAKVRCS